MKKYKALFLIGSGLVISSCSMAGIAGMAGVAVGTAAVQEGGLSSAASDARIQIAINDLWFRHDVNMFAKLDLTINQGRVLITGVVQNPEHRVEAVRLAWQPKGVVQVINEIKVANSEGIVGFAKDAWITTRLRTALILDKEVESINYSIDTVQGVVYLMGFAQNQQELNHVMDIARRIENVKQVVSYVKLVGEPVVSGYKRQAVSGVHEASSFQNNGQVNSDQKNIDDNLGDPIDWSQESVY